MLLGQDDALFSVSRLVSAYQEKFLDKQAKWFIDDFMQYFTEITFRNFVKYIIKEGKKKCRYKSAGEPTTKLLHSLFELATISQLNKYV